MHFGKRTIRSLTVELYNSVSISSSNNGDVQQPDDLRAGFATSESNDMPTYRIVKESALVLVGL